MSTGVIANAEKVPCMYIFIYHPLGERLMFLLLTFVPRTTLCVAHTALLTASYGTICCHCNAKFLHYINCQ